VRVLPAIMILVLSLPVNASKFFARDELKDLHLGEVFFYAHQQKYFEALASLDAELAQFYEVDERQLNSLAKHHNLADFSVGEIELQYRMHKRADKAIRAVLGSEVDLLTRNRAVLALANLLYQKDDPQGAIVVLESIKQKAVVSNSDDEESTTSISGDQAEQVIADADYLKALSYVSIGQYSKAIESFEKARGFEHLEGYWHYNYATAFLLNNQPERAFSLYNSLGRISTDDPALAALKDKVNLKLANFFMDKNNSLADPKQAKDFFDRVRLDGPFSNQALLGSGWAALSDESYQRAIVPWTLLHERNITDESVQESMMALPYAYSKLQVYGKAANLYHYAVNQFTAETQRLDQSIRMVRDGSFLKAMTDKRHLKDENWLVNLRTLPETPETHYILSLMASAEFQSFYQNYKDLDKLNETLDHALTSLDAYEDIIAKRRAYIEPLLPAIEARFKQIDSKLRLRVEQRDNLAKKLNNILVQPRPEFLAFSNERFYLNRIAQLERKIPSKSGQSYQRLQRLKGVVLWNIYREYDRRLTDSHKSLMSLDDVIAKEKEAYNSFVRTRQAATQSYEGYTIPITRIRAQIENTKRRLEGVQAKQGHLMETLAINELDRRRKRLESYQIKARFAMAENYDRAIKAESDAEIKAIQERKLQLEKEQELLELQNQQQQNQKQQMQEQQKSSSETNSEERASLNGSDGHNLNLITEMAGV